MRHPTDAPEVAANLCSKPGGPVPEGWLPHLVREAPFDTGEVLVRCDTIKMLADATHGLPIDVHLAVPTELPPLLREAFYGIFVSASEDVTLTGNRVEEAPANFKGLLGIGPWNTNIRGQE